MSELPVVSVTSEFYVRDYIDFEGVTGLSLSSAVASMTARFSAVDDGDIVGLSTDEAKTLSGVYWLLARRVLEDLSFDTCLGLAPGHLMRLMSGPSAPGRDSTDPFNGSETGSATDS